MSTFKPIEKKRAKELEQTTTPFINVMGHGETTQAAMKSLHDFHHWLNDRDRLDDAIFFKGLYEKGRYISDKLGMKQTFWVTYYVKHDVWAFECKSNEYLLYFSNEGLTLQVSTPRTDKEVLAVIEELIEKWKS